MDDEEGEMLDERHVVVYKKDSLPKEVAVRKGFYEPSPAEVEKACGVCVPFWCTCNCFRRTRAVGPAETNASIELELELIQSHMAQKPVLRGEVGCA